MGSIHFTLLYSSVPETGQHVQRPGGLRRTPTSPLVRKQDALWTVEQLGIAFWEVSHWDGI